MKNLLLYLLACAVICACHVIFALEWVCSTAVIVSATLWRVVVLGRGEKGLM
jgi:hypothetical protein